ncbi:ParB/RepB/Spo0J family partition protein [Haloarcula amylolytica]|uniref:ParB/RepB/Spo0J family partition protein n=1 Tax=Haloarcula amylolytica TaxID=396317 RepID=UPI003C793BC8
MTANPERETIPEGKLPSEYDKLVAVDSLVHGTHNPRRVTPSEELRASIAETGLSNPLIVRPDATDEVYHITDGWQRYQAATACGWEQLPVQIYETALDALAATETASIVREWSTYEWAQYCQSVASELEAESTQELAELVADRTVKAPRTVRRYFNVLSLPAEIHPLLIDGPTGTSQQWTALKHHNSKIRRFDGLRWTVAGYLARRQAAISKDRVVGIAAMAVEFDHSDDAMEFVDRAVEATDTPLATVREGILFGQQHPRYLEVPRVAVALDREEKQAVMEYCHQNRRSLTDVVTETIRSLATDVVEET